MPNDQENLFTSPADQLPNVDLGAQQPQPANQGENPYTADQPRVVGEEHLGEMQGPQQVSAAEELATSAVGRVDVQDDNPTTATVAYPELEAPTASEVAAESGLPLPGSETPAASVELPRAEQPQVPVTHYEENSGQSVALPVIGETPTEEQPVSDQNLGQ